MNGRESSKKQEPANVGCQKRCREGNSAKGNILLLSISRPVYNALHIGALVHISSPNPHSNLVCYYFLLAENKLLPRELKWLAPSCRSNVPQRQDSDAAQESLFCALSTTPFYLHFAFHLEGIFFSHLNSPIPKDFIFPSLREWLRHWRYSVSSWLPSSSVPS